MRSDVTSRTWLQRKVSVILPTLPLYIVVSRCYKIVAYEIVTERRDVSLPTNSGYTILFFYVKDEYISPLFLPLWLEVSLFS